MKKAKKSIKVVKNSPPLEVPAEVHDWISDYEDWLYSYEYGCPLPEDGEHD